MENCLCFPHTINILFNYSLPKIHENGLILEFGVRKGLTIKQIVKKINKRTCHGFDSFEGLPEDWSGQQYPKGAYSEKGKRPKVPKNVVLHQGWNRQLRRMASACDYEVMRLIRTRLGEFRIDKLQPKEWMRV